ncbi:hypothetical protein HHK36_017437 [Tetracentron sinense]|uniref:VQ domain-containing protein n=1 Tax=Tetracentron sinense TaxID=13715 RepID=A0A835DBX3_TETSI|nr:hypothetical protein HHK36_017437 [Tetracentron sinense]
MSGGYEALRTIASSWLLIAIPTPAIAPQEEAKPSTFIFNHPCGGGNQVDWMVTLSAEDKAAGGICVDGTPSRIGKIPSFPFVGNCAYNSTMAMEFALCSASGTGGTAEPARVSCTTFAVVIQRSPQSPLHLICRSDGYLARLIGMIKAQTCEPKSTPLALAMHKDSHGISKFKPKIRIIHIFAPEIIKTDVANFRELVQRLTGKPTDRKIRKKKSRSVTVEESRTLCRKPIKTTELQDGFQSLEYGEIIKEEEEMWGCENSSGFFGGLGDFNGFIQGLGDFPLLPLRASHMDVFGETQIS